jgi:DNA ligase-1
LICEGTDDGRQIRVNVGTGFSDINRNEYWDSRATLLSELVEVEADAITQNQDGSYSLRFPRFARFRSLGDGIKV